MTLTLKEKELVAIGASVAAGCKPCTNYHFRKVREVSASDEEIEQAISDAIRVRDCAKEVMETHALRLLGRSREDVYCGGHEDATRITQLICVAAAFAVNCTSSLQEHIDAARRVGVSDEELNSALDLASFIRAKAASHVDRMASEIESVVATAKG
jgi:AhpD family alkylhydroperoxidase